MIDIKEHKISNGLKNYVRKITVFKSSGPIQYHHKLIPSGSTYLSYNHKEIPIFIFNNKKLKPKERLQIAGPKTTQEIHINYKGELNQILIEFTPSGFYYLFYNSPYKLINSLSNLSEFAPPNTVSKLEQDLLALNESEHQLDRLQNYLIEISYRALPFCKYIEKAIQIINENKGTIAVKDLAKMVIKSERQLNRMFSKIVGISPKLYSKIVQLHYAINLMHLKDYSSLKEIFYDVQFYDHSHFDRRFKELVGLTPNQFLKSKAHNALKYFTHLIEHD